MQAFRRELISQRREEDLSRLPKLARYVKTRSKPNHEGRLLQKHALPGIRITQEKTQRDQYKYIDLENPQ